jgi:hypothetical protein
MARGVVLWSLTLTLAGCSESGRAMDAGSRDRDAAAGELQLVADQGPPWTLAFEERFEGTTLGAPSWIEDPVPDDGPFADGGLYFTDRGVTPPTAFRITQSFGQAGWLTAEAYSRSSDTAWSSLLAVVDDPAGGGNKVLRLATPAHTDGVVIRSSQPLPERYRISLRVGYASYGDGKPGLNGYQGGETAEPWLDADATEENGFYWLAILDARPRPHNNVWIHHHRKLCIDSDNNYPPWMEIWTGQSFVQSGERPIMLLAVDGQGKGLEKSGKPFLSQAAGTWQPSGKIRALDRYKPKTWYQVSLARDGDRFTVAISGDFEFGGQRSHSAELDAASRCVLHYNRTPLPASSPCGDPGHYPSLPADQVIWDPSSSFPDYFMFGDPHNNYYTGEVYFDDVRLEVR